MKKLVKLATFILAVSIIFSTLFTGCGNGENNTDSKKTIFNVALSGDIKAVDPAFGYDRNTNAVVLQVTEGLFYYDVNNKIVPRLAKSYKVVNPTTYVYEIRNDVNFSDGTPLTVDDVVFSLNRYKDPSNASEVAWMFANVTSITKTGDWEVTVKLSKPDALWEQTLATTAGYVYSKKYYEEHKNNFGKPDGGILGTGPFVFKKWVTGSEIDLEKNTKYWDKSVNIAIDKIVYKIIPDSTTRVKALTSGQVDYLSNAPIDQLDQLKASQNINVSKVNSFTINFIAFNTEREPFNDVNVRKAIYYSIDANSIVSNIFKNTTILSNSLPINDAIVSTEKDLWSSYIKNAPDYKYNIDKAKEYLSKSSVPNGFKFTLIVNDEPAYYSSALLLQQALKQINIDVTVQKVTWSENSSYQFGSRFDKDEKRDYDALLTRWTADFPDADGNLTPLYKSANKGKGGSNSAAYTNAEVDKLLDEQSSATDKGERAKLQQQILNILSDEVPYAIISYPQTIFAINKNIKYTFGASWLYNIFFKDFEFVDN